MTHRFDMLVIGAGPAGLTAALRLNQLGHRVLLIDRSDSWPRQQIGEALTPGVLNIVDYLDARAVLDTVPLLAGNPTRVRWTSDEIQAVAHDGAVVDRAALDDALLRLARSRGVHVLLAASLKHLEGEPGAWRAQVATSAGLQYVDVQALLDARGRQSRREPQHLRAPRLSTMWAEIEAAMLARGADPSTRVEALPDGWMWGAALPDGRYRIMFTFDPAVRDDAWTHEHETRLRHACARSVLFKHLEDLPWSDSLRMCVSTPYVDALSWQDARVKLGDAAFALDPISSSGVEKAMRFSLQAAVALNTWCRTGDAAERALARRFFESRLVETAARHLMWTAGYYRQSWCRQSPFWYERSAPSLTHDVLAPSSADEAAAARVDEMTRALHAEWSRASSVRSEPVENVPPFSLRDPIRFARDAEVVSMPCVTGDRVTAQSALQHPSLDRPIAFWGDVALFPMLDRLHTAVRPLELIPFLGTSMGMDRAHHLLEWLWKRGVVEAAM